MAKPAGRKGRTTSGAAGGDVALLTRARFVQWDGFVRDWRDLRLGDEELRALELMVMLNPNVGPVVPGTGGVRKARFAPASWGTGKRGGLRVWYLHVAEDACVFWLAAYAKGAKESLTKSEAETIRKLVVRIRAILADRGISRKGVR